MPNTLRQKDRQTEREREKESQRERDNQQRSRQKYRETDRQTYRQTKRQAGRMSKSLFSIYLLAESRAGKARGRPEKENFWRKSVKKKKHGKIPFKGQTRRGRRGSKNGLLLLSLEIL